jgi:hypothetical protein
LASDLIVDLKKARDWKKFEIRRWMNYKINEYMLKWKKRKKCKKIETKKKKSCKKVKKVEKVKVIVMVWHEVLG